MRAHECFHCKQWIEEGEEHDCWTTTEAALTKDLPEDLRDAWDRLRETAAELGEQRIYASHHSIMFARKVCYFFVRPGTKYLELCIFLGRPVNASQVRKIVATSKTKYAHMLRLTHRDEVEAPVTDWLREAYEFTPQNAAKTNARKAETPVLRKPRKAAPPNRRKATKRTARKSRRARP